MNPDRPYSGSGVFIWYLAVLLGGLLLLGQSGPAMAQEGDAPLIGINVPLSGPYKKMGKNQVRAYKLAVERVNEQGGVLGEKLQYKVMDSKSDPGVARQNAQELVQEHDVDMVTGGISSASAIAQSEVCQENGVVFMTGLTHSTATTGFEQEGGEYGEQKAHRHTFRWYFNAWMTQNALTSYLMDKFGSGTDFYYITADYTWGRSLEHVMQYSTESQGGNTLGGVRTPLGHEDFSQEVEKAAQADPDILVLVLTGQDVIQALKQVNEAGLDEEAQVVVPAFGLDLAHAVGPSISEGIIATVNWYWSLADRYQGSREFVQAYRSSFGYPPPMEAACGWVAVHEWASAVERAGSLASPQVVRALEGHEFQLLKGKERWREWDHQAVSSVYIVEGKSRQDMSGEWDLLRIVQELPGSEMVRTREENPVMLEPLE